LKFNLKLSQVQARPFSQSCNKAATRLKFNLKLSQVQARPFSQSCNNAPAFYQTHLQSQLTQSHYLLLCCLIKLLHTVRQVRLEALATALPLPILFESRRRHLQRFLKLPTLTFETLWFPIVSQWLTTQFAPTDTLYVAIDRTSWGIVNLLVVSLIVNRRAIPLYRQRLNKLGSSNLSEQQTVLTPVLTLLKAYSVVVLGDREFCSVKLAHWLAQSHVGYCLRLKRSESVEVQEQVWVALNALGLKPGTQLFLGGVRITKHRGFGGLNLAAKWQLQADGWSPEAGWFLVTSFTTVAAAVSSYRLRFDIEEMFRDWKGSGYNLEGTGVTSTRLIPLIVVLTLAYSSATLQGNQIQRKGVSQYIGRVQEPTRTVRRHSRFYIGLQGQNWLNFQGYYADRL
jgi:hypothetical protein